METNRQKKAKQAIRIRKAKQMQKKLEKDIKKMDKVIAHAQKILKEARV
tara:strand:+ start:923 stop:1069 length:147 start_codon:yes stop_codon:yes gene_type:complete